MIEVVHMHLLCIYAVSEEVGEEDKYVQVPIGAGENFSGICFLFIDYNSGLIRC